MATIKSRKDPASGKPQPKNVLSGVLSKKKGCHKAKIYHCKMGGKIGIHEKNMEQIRISGGVRVVKTFHVK